MDKEFNDLIMMELSENLNDDLLELFDNYDNDDIYTECMNIENILKKEGF